MSDIQEEIKEILDNFEKYEARYRLHDETQFIITHREIQILLDCITNLQQENKRLKNRWRKYNQKIEDYKSRNEKAISYIKENGCFNEEYKLCTKPFNTLKLDDLLNILQGSDNNE